MRSTAYVRLAIFASATTLVLTACSSAPKDDMGDSNLVFRKENDPELAKATQEARSHWSIFTTAFAARDKTGKDFFTVKAPISDNGETEYFWIDVDAVNANTVLGRYDSDGDTITTVHKGDKVTVKAVDVVDWEVSSGDRLKGDYSCLVLIADGIAQINGIPRNDRAKRQASTAQLEKHWLEIDTIIKAKGPVPITDADTQTMDLVRKMDRVIEGNTGNPPSARQLAKVCDLPQSVIETIRYVYTKQ
jgi:uncharacterized protein YegJ (DUF2314 family)